MNSNLLSFLSLLFGLITLTSLSAKEPKGSPPPLLEKPAAFCRYVFQHSDDFAWENNLVAFRTYGPAMRAGVEDSGIECGPKQAAYPVINRWYLNFKKGAPHQKDPGEGFGFYQVGGSRGCGGTGLWRDGGIITPDTYLTWQIINPGNSKCIFELMYEYPTARGKAPIREVKRISLGMGQRFFRSESTFTRDGQALADLPVAIGVTTHEGKAACTLNSSQRWVACWEEIEGEMLGTGAVLAPNQPIETREIRNSQPDQSHAVILTRTNSRGVVVHYAGFAWTRACAIRSPKDWAEELSSFSKVQNGK